ncbi:hypothetical protein PybrP1_012170, partial [[Pythium] brassicae (nom. inval.)]
MKKFHRFLATSNYQFTTTTTTSLDVNENLIGKFAAFLFNGPTI